jgi:hypothetical protein
MEESDIRREVYQMLKRYGLWPIHARDAMICQYCHKPVVNFEQGRPDLINLNPLHAGSVIEAKAVNLNREKSLAFAEIKDVQRKWLNAWQEAKGKGYLAVGTVGTMKRQVWLIDWATWKSLEVLAGLAGKKSVGIQRLTDDYHPWELIRITGGWKLPEAHSLLSLIEKEAQDVPETSTTATQMSAPFN